MLSFSDITIAMDHVFKNIYLIKLHPQHELQQLVDVQPAWEAYLQG